MASSDAGTTRRPSVLTATTYSLERQSHMRSTRERKTRGSAPTTWLSRRRAALGTALLTLVVSATLPGGPAAAADPHLGGSAGSPDLGANVVVFTPSMPTADIRARVDAIYAQQADSEMGTGRYALLFEPGTYGSATDPLDIPVGYYTEVAGLGQDPSAVTINGGVTAIGKNGSGSLDISGAPSPTSPSTWCRPRTAATPATRCGRSRRRPRCVAST